MSNKNEGERLEAIRRLHLLEGYKEERYDRVVRIVRKILDVPFAGISVVDEARQWYKSVDGIDPGVLPRETSFCDYTVDQEEIFEVEDLRADPRFGEFPMVVSDPNVVFYVGHPLKTPDGHNVGALCAADFRPRKLDADQRELLRDFSAIVEEQFVLGLLVNRDALTGLFNRSFLDECLAREWRRHARGGSPLSLIFIDVDYFKEYNDEYGHLRGDQCLQKISETLVNTLSRAGDFVARYGGEEFVVLLPDTNASGARQLAERLRLAVSGMAIDQAPECPKPVVTVSVGVAAAIPETSQKATTLLASADEALYQAKRSGRDQVCWG